jgi:zinc protease
MTRVICFLVVSLVPALLAVARDSKETKIFPYQINQVTLDNGLKIVSIPFESPGIIAYYTVVRTGSRNEIEPGKSGFAHFFEHMMFRGTDKYSKDKFTAVLKEIGADNNANTSDDQTIYHTVASSDALETIMDLESDRFMNLKYSEEDFKTEAGAILGEYNKSSSNPFQAIDEKLRDVAFTAHTYKHTTIGFLKDIQDMPNQYQYSLTFFDRWYRPENCVVVVVGDFQQDKLIALATKYYGSWKKGSYTLNVPVEPPQTAEKVVNMPWKAKTLPILTLAYHGPAFDDKSIDGPAVDLLSQVAFSQTSELYRKLVVDDQIAESVGGGPDETRDPGLFSVFSRIKDVKNIQKVKEAILQAIEDVKTKPVSPERLAAIKSHTKYEFAMGLDNADHVASMMCHIISLTNNPESVNAIHALYDKVTPEDIMAAAKKYLGEQNRTVLVLTQQAQEVKQ